MDPHSKTRTPKPAERGFTLIESLVAISVLILAITATLSVASKSISAAGIARDQVTAFYLAQEAVEYVRNTRDNNALGGANWLAGLASCVGANCSVDSPDNTVASCGTECPLLRLNSQGLYGYASGNETIFRRSVQLNEVVAGREATLDVVLRWKRGVLERTFTIREHIFNWK
ncbi:MAG: type II secretion system protein [Parcubacteria group bacterium]|nr:type II secretion system protein [Parcubacteria group bacterium]